MIRWLVEALLGVAPLEFRRRHGEELLAVHDERAAAKRNLLNGSVFALREVLGALVLVVRLHVGLGDDNHREGGEATMFETTRQDVRFAASSNKWASGSGRIRGLRPNRPERVSLGEQTW